MTFVVTAPFSGSLEVFLPMKRGGGGNRTRDSGPPQTSDITVLFEIREESNGEAKRVLTSTRVERHD